jgi:hypothetical protein
VEVVKDDRIVDQPRRVGVAESHLDACSKRHNKSTECRRMSTERKSLQSFTQYSSPGTQYCL